MYIGNGVIILGRGGGVIAFYSFNSQKITHLRNDHLLCSIKNKLLSFALHAVKK